MNRRTMRWLIAWGVLAAAIFVSSFFWGRVNIGQIASFLIFVVAAIALVLARPLMKRFPSERRVAVDFGKTNRFQKYLLPVGGGAVLAGFVWVIAFAHAVPDSQSGVLILFFPSISLLVFGVSAIAFRIYVWFFGD